MRTRDRILGMYDAKSGKSDPDIIEATAEHFQAGTWAFPTELLAEVKLTKAGLPYAKAKKLAYGAWVKASLGIDTKDALNYGNTFGEGVLGYLAQDNAVAALKAAFTAAETAAAAAEAERALEKAAPSKSLGEIIERLRNTANAVDRGAVLTAEDNDNINEILDLVEQIRQPFHVAA